MPLTVEGPGLIDCHLYRQRDRLILHLVNLTSAGTWRAPIHELIPVGPLQVRVRIAEDMPASTTKCLVSQQQSPTAIENGWAIIRIPSILDHEVIVLE